MLKNLINYLSYIPKRLVAVSVLAVMVLTPLQAVFANDVTIESALGIANVTAGDTQYQKSVNAKVDDVLKLEVWYHNRELADSGKVANNLRVKINLPNQPGQTQTMTSTVSADNSNTVTDSVTANLSLPNAFLEYIPGSAFWRHNAGTNENVNYVTEQISDAVVTSPTGIVLENAQPCFNFEATVTILVRVKAPGVSIVKKVRHVGEQNWTTETAARIGEELEYLITVKNEGNTTLNNLSVADNLPGPMVYVPGSTMVKNANNPDGVPAGSDNVTTGGINVGHYEPGSNVHVWFKVKLTDQNLECGPNRLTNVGVTRPEGMNEFYNTAYVNVEKECDTPPTPVPPQPPVTPASSLPSTGPGEMAAGLLGSAGLGMGIRNYLRSRRSLLDALLNK